MTREYRYRVTTCPYCGNDLTEEDGITIEGNCDGFAVTAVASRLEPDGTLVDAFDIVERGLHSETRCGRCDESLVYEEQARGD